MTTPGRLVIVVALVVAVAAVVLVARSRSRLRSRRLGKVEFPPGLYLLTSDECSTCGRARDRLEEMGVRFSELSWQADPEAFRRLGVDAVPSVVSIDEDGEGRWWRGGVPARGQIPGNDGGGG